MGGDNVENFDANAGTNKLANGADVHIGFGKIQFYR